MRLDIRAIVERFPLLGDYRGAEPYGSGHINDTYCAHFNQGGSVVRYIFQRINEQVFKQPVKVMENVERVTRHIHAKLKEERIPSPSCGTSGKKPESNRETGDISRRVLTLVPTREGRFWYVDDEGGYWRCYVFIEGATSHDRVENASQAFEAARAFGLFQRQLADLPAPALHETVPFFHHTRSRFNALLRSIELDGANRAVTARDETGFCLQREAISDVWLNLQAKGVLRERVTHNDTKLNNVMLDDATGQGVCVIDLDTVMPGLVLNDFGDLCRTAACATLEDEADLARVEMRFDMFEAIARGYLQSTGGWLTRAELDQLPFSARLITFEVGVRFLTDYLEGDRYFKTHRPLHNLQRARTQFKLVRSFEENEAAMRQIIERACASFPTAPAEIPIS